MAAATKSRVADFFKTYHDVKFVRLHWTDYSGILRARIITKVLAERLASGTEEYSVPQNCMVLPITGGAAGFSGSIEDWKLRPDWTSLIVCGFRPSHASVMCFTAHLGLENSLSRCPRNLLSGVLEDFETTCGTKILMGFEIEFSLHDESHNIVRSIDWSVGHCMLAGLRTKNLDIIEEVVAALEVSGIETYHFHVEEADQFEIAVAPLPPMQAIDALMITQETIRSIFVHHGIRASLAPKPVLRGPRNGLHVHLSLNPITSAAPSFLAGVLPKLRALCAFGLPSFDSYSRVSEECVGEWVGYGTGNRDLPVRKINESRWEFRCMDSTANVYLFAAALISAGMEGIKSGQNLTMRDCQILPCELPVEEAKQQLDDNGITDRLPRTLVESLEAVKGDEEIKAWVGDELLRMYLKVKEKDAEKFGEMSDEERRTKHLDYF